MPQSKAKYHRLHVDEETADGTSGEKHTSNKLSVVTWSKAALVLVIVLGVSLLLPVIFLITSKSHDREGEYI